MAGTEPPPHTRRVYNIGRPRDSDGDTGNANSTGQEKLSLAQLNALVDDGWRLRFCNLPVRTDLLGDRFPTQHLWHIWLWEADPEEPFKTEILMNRNQMTGLLLARVAASVDAARHESIDTVASIIRREYRTDWPHTFSINLTDAPIREYTLRELRDTLQNIQMAWVKFRIFETRNGIREALGSLFHRFGVLASVAAPDSVMDDQGSVEDDPGNEGLLRLTRVTLRRFCVVFQILYRCLHFHENAVAVDAGSFGDSYKQPEFEIFHTSAASEDFGGLSIRWDLPVGAKTQYVNDFPGMDNSISKVCGGGFAWTDSPSVGHLLTRRPQVIYYHQQNYQKRMQVRRDFERLGSGRDIEAVHVVPCLMQIHPEITLAYDGDVLPSLIRKGSSTTGMSAQQPAWQWVLMGNSFFLLSPDGCIYHHDNVIVLYNQYLRCTGSSDGGV